MNEKKMLAFAIGPIAGALIAFITLPLISFYYSPEDLGRLSILQVLMNFGLMLFSLGMHQAYVREFHEYEDKGSLQKMLIIPSMLFSAIVLTIIGLFPASLSKMLFDIDTDNKIYQLLFVFSVFIIVINNHLAHILRMEERGISFSLTQVTPKLAMLLIIFAFVFLGFPSVFINLLFANTLSQLISLFLFIFLIRSNFDALFNSKINYFMLKKMLLFSFPLVMGSLAYWGLTAMDRFFIKSLSNLYELGIYAVAASFAAVATVISSIFSNIWHPIIYKWIKEGVDKDRIVRVMEYMTLVVALIWTLAGIFSWGITLIMPTEYAQVEYLFTACIAMPLIYLLSDTTKVGINISRRSSFSMYAALSALLMNVILNFLLVPNYGSAGAAIATVLSFLLFFMLLTEFSVYLWGYFPRKKIYLNICMYCCFSIFLQLNNIAREFYIPIWALLFIFSVLIFKKRSIELQCLLTERFWKKNANK
jgi:O-antigen/teichoic acid export membrane protein